MMRHVVLGLAFWSLGCASSQSAAPALSEIRVLVRVSREEAFRQARVAFEAEGLEIDPPLKRDTILYSMPRLISPGIAVTYRAVAHAVDSGSVVILTGTVNNRREAAWDAAMLGIPKRREDPLTSRSKGDEQFGWQLLQRIAGRLREGDLPKP
jgi:hypothetical protein